MSAALVSMSGESKHEPARASISASDDVTILSPTLYLSTMTKARGPIITYGSAAQSLKTEEHRVTRTAHDADIARNPIIDCS